MEELLSELQEDLELELALEFHRDSDRALLSSKIKGAYREIKFRRNYQEHHTEEFIDFDMEKMYPLIKYLALYDWNQIGGDGETAHSENGISRTWRSRDEILRQVVPFVTVL